MNFNYAMLITLQDANGKNHINGIENFFSKRVRLISSKQNAAKHKSYDLCCYCLLKGYERSEVEFRYNNNKDTKELYHILLKMIRENPLKFR